MPRSLHLSSFAALSLSLITAAAAMGLIKSAANVTLPSGPNAGTYTIESDEPCTIKPRSDGDPKGFRVNVDTSDRAKSYLGAKPHELHAIVIDIPNIGAPHLAELQIDVVFGDPESRKTQGNRYAIDTVPDGATKSVAELDEIMKNGGLPRKRTGKGGATLADHGATAALTFWGETAEHVSFKGTVECRRVSHE
jgi:hypothetical protein